MLCALVAGIVLSRPRQRRLGLTLVQRVAVGLGAFCGGMLGSKFPFAIADPQGAFCTQSWISNGKTVLFGLIGGYLGVELAKWLSDVKTKTGDSFAVPVAVAIGVGRMACFVAGCCYGVPTSLPWGVDFGDGVRRHPTQIYEMIFHFSAAIMLIQLERKNLFPTQRFKLYLLAYCSYRFVSEFIRPESHVALGLTAYQWGTLAMIPMICLLWWHDQNLLRTTKTGIQTP